MDSYAQVLTPSARRVFAAGVLASLYKLAIQVTRTLCGNVAFPELLGPVQSALSQVTSRSLVLFPTLHETFCVAPEARTTEFVGGYSVPRLNVRLFRLLVQIQPKAKPSLPKALLKLHADLSRQLATAMEKVRNVL